MPIYEYSCKKCGTEFEVTQRITEEPLTKHEGCGGEVRRLISLTAFSLKGDGWYSDHYGLKKNGNGASESTGSKKDSPESTTKKDESKKDAAAPSKSTSSETTPSVGKAA